MLAGSIRCRQGPSSLKMVAASLKMVAANAKCRREREETSCPATALAEGGATLRREDVQW